MVGISDPVKSRFQVNLLQNRGKDCISNRGQGYVKKTEGDINGKIDVTLVHY